MTHSEFDKRVLIEQLRYIEAEETLAGGGDVAAADIPAHSDFDRRLWLRAQRLIDRNKLKPALARAARRSRLASGLATLVAALLGCSAAAYAVSAGNTINIYWLLLVLLGFNLLSMLLWLVGISFAMDGLMAAVLSRISGWLPVSRRQNSNAAAQADRAWLACHYGGRLGKWRLSKITHQLWLVYLLAGLGVLVLILLARQYDFVWGTTLLSDAAFQNLTERLGAPLQALGFATPSAQQVQETRIGAEYPLTAAHRSNWAQFLLGALLVFGLLPRLLLWTWAALMHHFVRRRFSLDYYLPYYISLRQQLMPLAGRGEVVDADGSPSAESSAAVVDTAQQHVPPEAQWVAVELGEDIQWPPGLISGENDLGRVTDRESLARVIDSLQQDTGQVVAVAVAAGRPPDRGVQRMVASILATGSQAWLVLLQKQHNEIAEKRLGAWYRLAESCAVPADHVVGMSVA